MDELGIRVSEYLPNIGNRFLLTLQANTRSMNRAKLEKRYRQLIEESYKLSTTNRKASDAKRAEAEAILKELGVSNMRTP